MSCFMRVMRSLKEDYKESGYSNLDEYLVYRLNNYIPDKDYKIHQVNDTYYELFENDFSIIFSEKREITQILMGIIYGFIVGVETSGDYIRKKYSCY